MLAGFQTVPIDNFDPIPRKPGRPLAAHGRNQRGKFAGAIAHQFRRGVRLQAIEFIIDRDDGGSHIGFLRPVRCAHRGLHTKHHLAHQLIDGGKQERAGVLLLRGAPIPQIEAVGAQDPLQRGAHHDGDRTLFYKSFKHLTKHGCLLHSKIEEDLSYIIGHTFTPLVYGPIMVLYCWAKGYKEPLYLVSNMLTAEEACRWYEKRFRIETFFSDQKSRGFHLHNSHFSDPQRLSRLLIAACLAYIWIVYLGSLCEKEGWREIIHRRKRCDLSLFQLGLRVLEHLLNEEMPIPVQFHVTI